MVAEDIEAALPPRASASASAGSDAETRMPAYRPADVRGAALVVIAALLCVFALHWAGAVVIPVLLGLMMSCALAPAVNGLLRWRVPRSVAAGLVVTGAVAATGWGVWSLRDQADAVLQSLPEVAQKVQRLTAGRQDGTAAAIVKVQQAASQIEKVVQETSSASAPPPGLADASRDAKARKAKAAGPTPVVVVSPGLNLMDYLWTGTLGAITALGQAAIVLCIALFFLASGDRFRRKLVKLAGPRLSQKKITVQALDEINGQIQRYLVVQVLVSIVVGVLTGLAFYAIGLEQAAVWGVVAGVTNLVPYVGAIATGAGATVFAAAQFGAFDMALLTGGVSFAIHAVVGNILTPWWLGKTSRISPIAVFLSLLVFGWMWGVSGLLLGVPVLMVTKSICDRVEPLQPVGELLGD